MDDWSPIVPALFGLFGTIVGATAAYQATVFQFNRQSQSERRRLLLEKLEELYALITEMRANYAEVYAYRFKPLMTPSEAGDKLAGVAVERKVAPDLRDFQTIDMIILYYFPAMKALLPALVDSRVQYKTSMNNSQTILFEANKKVAKSLDGIQAACLVEAQSLVAKWDKLTTEYYS